MSTVTEMDSVSRASVTYNWLNPLLQRNCRSEKQAVAVHAVKTVGPMSALLPSR